MPKYIVQMVDACTREALETHDMVFDTVEDAENYIENCGGNYPSEEVAFVVEALMD